MITVEIIKECWNQDSKKRLYPGDIVVLSEFEAGRHLAEGNARNIEKRELIETAVNDPPETMIKRRGRPKHGSNR